MNLIFYIAAFVALLATIMVVTRKNAVHAMIYLVVSLLAISVIFFIVGAPFVAALEVIVYAGAILVLMLFAVMMLDLGRDSGETESKLMSVNVWAGPAILCAILLAEIVYVILNHNTVYNQVRVIDAGEVSSTLFGGYVLAIELTGMLLMAGIVGAYHIGREKKREYHRYLQVNEEEND